MENNKVKIIYILFIFIILFAVSGCSLQVTAEVPPGFAVSKKRGSFLIYSPDGFKMKIKAERNNPQKDTLFWTEALKTHLVNNGYFLLDEAPFYSKNLEGVKFTWLMPVAYDYYKYMTAVAVKGNKIYIIEASGEKKLFETYEEDIETIISSIHAGK